MPTLLVMRHAKSSWSTGHEDHDRPLAPRGLRQGLAAGQWLVENHPTIDRVLCSTAMRARQTLERVIEGGMAPAEVTFHEELYPFTPDDVYPVMREHLKDEGTVLVIGHVPGVSELVDDIASAEEIDFVTSGIAVLRIDRPWREIGAGGGSFISFVAPGRT